MMLYLIRHAHAVDADEDPARPLSEKGWTQVARLVAGFRANPRLQPAEIWHSPLARSRETAALLAGGLGLAAPLILVPGIEPEDDPAQIVPRLTAAKINTALVGHEPHLGLLTRRLLEGPTEFVFRKASVLALARDPSGWRIVWHTSAKA
jgi:phosphohistidine phosphatase